jgi:hypothetical protein
MLSGPGATMTASEAATNTVMLASRNSISPLHKKRALFYASRNFSFTA